jgi:hypothetical protein
LRNWAERHKEISSLAERQLFFIGGAPRSGTTWLQQILDAHPDVSCKGEGLFLNHLAGPLEKMMMERSKALDEKNKNIFQHTGGYPLPVQEDMEFLIGTAILLALHRQSVGKPHRAIGEKTPENVFFYPRLRQLFPTAKFISIARDPRDVLTSAWHFFRKPVAPQDEAMAKLDFIRNALPALNEGTRKMIAFNEEHPKDHIIVTYEDLRSTPVPIIAKIFGLLGVPDHDSIVKDCLTRTEFEMQTKGRADGLEQNGSFFRKGVTGDWISTLSSDMNDIILHELGWMFPYFRWHV